MIDLEQGLADLTDTVDDIVFDGGATTVDDVLFAIEDQGYLDVSQRWRIGFEQGFGSSFLIQDKQSNNNSGNNYYEFEAGQGA